MGRRYLAVGALWLALSAGCGGGGSAAAPPVVPNGSGFWRGQVGYEIFVRSFADSDGDGIGDLNGITAHLDDLNDGDAATTTDLGVDLLWLMPVFPSPSYHGYDVTDYQAVNPQYGTLADLDELVAQAHRRGMRVILDMVLNHSSSQHPWFHDALFGSNGKRDWYVWRTDDPGWTSPFSGAPVWHSDGSGYYYGIFAASMPDLNLANPVVEAALVDAMKFWLARGVDGFRLDAVRYLVETSAGVLQDTAATHGVLRRMRAALHATYPGALLVAEAWAPTATVATYYGAGDEVQLAFTFDQADALVRSAGAGEAGTFAGALSDGAASLAGKDLGFMAPFLTNHDQVRAMRTWGGDAGAARVAAAALFAGPGTPFLYYGEELGMQGGPGSADQQKRTPMRWTATAPTYGFTTRSTTWLGAASEAAGVDVASQRGDPASLWNLYRRLVSLRKAQPAFTTGALAFPAVTGGGAGVLAILRTPPAPTPGAPPAARVLLVANFGTAPTGPLTVTVAGTPASLLDEGLAGAPAAAGGAVTLPGLAARGFAYLTLD